MRLLTEHRSIEHAVCAGRGYQIRYRFRVDALHWTRDDRLGIGQGAKVGQRSEISRAAWHRTRGGRLGVGLLATALSRLP